MEKRALHPKSSGQDSRRRIVLFSEKHWAEYKVSCRHDFFFNNDSLTRVDRPLKKYAFIGQLNSLLK